MQELRLVSRGHHVKSGDTETAVSKRGDKTSGAAVSQAGTAMLRRFCMGDVRKAMCALGAGSPAGAETLLDQLLFFLAPASASRADAREAGAEQNHAEGLGNHVG